MIGLEIVDVLTASSPIPLPPSPDLSRTQNQAITQTVTPPAADAPLLIQPEVAQLASHREKLLREQRERALDLAMALHEPLPEERRPDTRSER